MNAALVGRHGVDFVEDHRAGARQHLPARFRSQQHIERFRRGHQDMRRPAAHLVAFGGRRVAGAHPGADLHLDMAQLAQFLGDSGQRRFEIAVNVVGQRLERRDIDHLHRVGQGASHALAHQIVDGGEEGGQGLARAGRGGDQRVPPGLDPRPGIGLGRRGRAESSGEPARHGGVEQPGMIGRPVGK